MKKHPKVESPVEKNGTAWLDRVDLNQGHFVRAKWVGFHQGKALVQMDGDQLVPASALAHVNLQSPPQSVLLITPQNNAEPIIVGLVQNEPESDKPQRLVLDAEQEIEIACGDARISLRRDGRIEIRGVELISRASKGNRIKGAYVNIN
ncbi:MAG: hypothetical protein KDC71_22440 [Acidobacteria bacterium]|nr:hypothetical protein [Acidobacteriota bacterium]